jgi:hypothetical protein
VDYTTATNEELASLGRQGDEGAVGELLERSYPALRAALLQVAAPEDTRDLAREAIVRAVRRCGANGGTHFLPWLDAVTSEMVQEKRPAEQGRNSMVPDDRTPEERWAAWEATWEASSHFDENRANFPVQELAPYIGQTVAWSPDGSRIVAAEATFGELWNKLRSRGEDPSVFVYEYLPSFRAEAVR